MSYGALLHLHVQSPRDLKRQNLKLRKAGGLVRGEKKKEKKEGRELSSISHRRVLAMREFTDS